MNRKFYLVAPVAALIAGVSSMPAAGAGPDGQLLFQQRCAACHTVTPGARTVLAPNLAGLANRKAASTAFNYSPALKASNITWTRANLDRFLTAPGRMVPGTRMVISITDPAQRAAVVNYISTRPAR